MKVKIVIVDHDESEEEAGGHGLEFDMPTAPQVGDALTVSHPNQAGSTSLVVRRAHWLLEHPDVGRPHRAGGQAIGTPTEVHLECEFTVGPYAAEEHR